MIWEEARLAGNGVNDHQTITHWKHPHEMQQEDERGGRRRRRHRQLNTIFVLLSFLENTWPKLQKIGMK